MKLPQAFDELFWLFRPHFQRPQTFARARALAYSHLVTYGRRTISRLICSKNTHHQDWSADYRFFSRSVWDPHALFHELFKASLEYSEWPNNVILCTLDASLGKKTGKTIPGVATLRDPMSLPYHTNLVRGLRYVAASVVVGPVQHLEYHRALPVYLEVAPPAKKPRKNASETEKHRYQQEKKRQNLSVQGRQAVFRLREHADALADGTSRIVVVTVDGSFCNRHFFKELPSGVIVIARARKDMKLFKPAETLTRQGKGRRRIYGERLPTPDAIRKDTKTYPWQRMRVYAAGKYHQLRYKSIGPVLWRQGTRGRPMRLLIIAPLRYRKSKNSRLLYRKPAYFLVEDHQLSDELLIQYYFLHWDIEVNHRDAKSLLGLYDAQVRSENSVKRIPQFNALIYSSLLLAGLRAYGPQRTDDYLPLPKWRKAVNRRASTLDILAQFRREIMYTQLKTELSLANNNSKPKKKNRRKRPRSNIEAKKRGFIDENKEQRSVLKLPVNLISALLYAYA